MRKLTAGQSCFLNALRYAAAGMVLLYHGLLTFFNKVGGGDRALGYSSQLGFVGVSIFFILSGFVIAHTVARKRAEGATYGVGTYVIERFSRISIVFVPALCTVALIDLLLIRRAYPGLDLRLWPYFWSTLFMLTGFTGFGPHAEPLPTILGMEPVWSLTYEVYLYAAFGAIVLFPRSARRRVAGLALLAAALFLLSRLPYALLMSGTWLLGALGAHLFRRGFTLSRPACAAVLGASGLAAAAITVLTGPERETLRQWAYVFLLAAAFSALLAAAGTLEITPRVGAAAKFLASYAYSMYLLHYVLLGVACNVLVDVRAIADQGPWIAALFVVALLAGVNAISYLFSLATERQTSRLKGVLLKATA
jgi:peptidoglycan/LPS O-acetylase OafA/YrhL